MPALSPVQRCALTTPFHPCLPKEGGMFSVALSLGPLISKKSGRALPGALSPWSPDFPRAAITPPAAVRPSGGERCEGSAGRGQGGGGFSPMADIRVQHSKWLKQAGSRLFKSVFWRRPPPCVSPRSFPRRGRKVPDNDRISLRRSPRPGLRSAIR